MDMNLKSAHRLRATLERVMTGFSFSEATIDTRTDIEAQIARSTQSYMAGILLLKEYVDADTVLRLRIAEANSRVGIDVKLTEKAAIDRHISLIKSHMPSKPMNRQALIVSASAVPVSYTPVTADMFAELEDRISLLENKRKRIHTAVNELNSATIITVPEETIFFLKKQGHLF
jgi:hypothetical protein